MNAPDPTNPCIAVTVNGVPMRVYYRGFQPTWVASVTHGQVGGLTPIAHCMPGSLGGMATLVAEQFLAGIRRAQDEATGAAPALSCMWGNAAPVPMNDQAPVGDGE